MSTTTLYMNDVFELSKPRIVLLALLMAALGYFMDPLVELETLRFVGMLVGTGLVGIAACAFNQHAERDIDSRMWRTMDRPLPSGRVEPKVALQLGWASAILGVLFLIILVNPVTAILGGFTILMYLGIYTPSKKLSPLSTLVGAIPGAMPPLMGWTAAHGSISPEGLLLFSILFVWQIPHFLAIGWIYREDYERGGLPILSVVDEMGSATAKHAVLYSVVLVPLTLVPSLWKITGTAYMWGAIFLGVVFLLASLMLAIQRTKFFARILFFASLIYLPALGVLMLWDRASK
jgi:heme o synthase